MVIDTRWSLPDLQEEQFPVKNGKLDLNGLE